MKPPKKIMKFIKAWTPLMMMTIGILWLLQGTLAHTSGHGIIYRTNYPSHDNIKPGTSVSQNLLLLNLSSLPVAVEVQPSCGCTVADSPYKILAPLHSTAVKAVVDTTGMRKGQQEKEIVLQMQANHQTWHKVVVIKFHII